ncbi:early endosome antigen 1-like [Macrobrachium nipponense]|uniref:early endosome antigen 1-like n=1 Tax=Macrobrachium nipponense TaxID=159736 RepID=UPI0030C88659
MFSSKLKAVCLQALMIIVVLLEALFSGLNYRARVHSGLLDQLIRCEQNGSPVEVLQWITSFSPLLGTLWKSTQDRQQCEQIPQNLETKIENVHSRLGIFGFMKNLHNSLFTDSWKFAGLCLTLGGILFMKTWLSRKEEEMNSIEEDADLVGEWWSTDSSLDDACVTEEEEEEEGQDLAEDPSDPKNKKKLEEIETLFELEKAVFEEKKHEMENEIGRLSDEMEVIRKDREAEMESWTKNMNDLEQTNTKQKEEITRLTNVIEDVKKNREAVIRRSTKTINDLTQRNQQLKAEAALALDDYEALQKEREEEKERANTAITDLQKMNDQLQREISSNEEMKKSILMLEEELTRAKEVIRVQIEKETHLVRENEDLERSIAEQNQIIEDISEERKRLKSELVAANINSELKGLKDKVILLETELASAMEENGALKEEVSRLTEMKKLQPQKQVRLVHHHEETLKDSVDEKTNRNSGIMTEPESTGEKEVLDKIKEVVLEDQAKSQGSKEPAKITVLKQSPVNLRREVIVCQGRPVDRTVRKGWSTNEASSEKEENVCNKLPENRIVRGLRNSGLGKMLTSSKALPEKNHADQKIANVKEKETCAKNVDDSQRPEKERSPKREKTQRKLITFDLEPDEPNVERKVFSHLGKLRVGLNLSSQDSRLQQRKPCQRDHDGNYLIFKGKKVPLTCVKDMEGYLTVELDIPRKFHRAINGIQGRTVIEITEKSGGPLIEMPSRSEVSDLITISGTITQVHQAAGHIEKLINKLY